MSRFPEQFPKLAVTFAALMQKVVIRLPQMG